MMAYTQRTSDIYSLQSYFTKLYSNLRDEHSYMTQLFGIPLDTLTIILLALTISIVAGVGLLAITNAIFFKIGIRNIPRRHTQMLLIVFALMLATTLLSGVLATGDVITAAVQTVAVSNLGNVDETIQSSGSPGFFDDRLYFDLRNQVRNDPNVGAIGAALIEQGILVADISSRQVRSKVTALGVIPGSEQGFGAIQDDASKAQYHIADLQTNEVYLNHTLAVLLNAHAGDSIYLYSKRWPGKRYTMHVRAIIADGGLVGEQPYIVSQVKTFRDIEHRFDDISQIFVSIHGTDAFGFDVSEAVKQTLSQGIPSYLHVNEVQEQGVHASQQADDIFSRIFSLFALFALAIGLLLIFLIFVLLAAERRAEMGMARAIGVQRRHLVLMYLFEGTVYDLLSSFVGLLIGVGVGTLLVLFLGPILERFNFPLKLVFQPRSLILAYCLGVIFTFFSVGVSAWLVSRMTVVDALRNLPESERPTLSLLDLLVRLFSLVRRAVAAHNIRRLLFEQLPDTIIGFIATLSRLGILPLAAGYGLMRFGITQSLIAPFSLGLSLMVIGAALLVKAGVEWVLVKLGRPRWRQGVRRVFAAVVGLSIMAYWALPFDAL